MIVSGPERRAIVASLILLLTASTVFAHDTSPSTGVGIDEHLGAYVPFDLRFVGEDGAPVSLRELVRAPTILSMVYYRCANICDVLIMGMADVVKSLPGKPGKDFTVLTISVNDSETPADARKVKKIGLESI